ncbi:alpha- -glucan synthase [Lasius niger]|uniref:Alpha--glucan synthase n=1 Tax=Lasius niger TaxID=67767 RepID=A0A0J7K7G9_LASNI|nr:alpha- -glucan synthase [Lasius niger]
MSKFSLLAGCFCAGFGIIAGVGIASAQQPTKEAFTMPFSHDPNKPNLPAPDTHLPYPNQPITENREDTKASVNSAGLPVGAKPDQAQQEAQSIIASDRGQAGQSHDEEDEVWNDPTSDNTLAQDNPDHALFSFP